MRSISFPQVLILLACIAAPIVAYKFLGSAEAAAATTGIGMIVTFLLGRPSDAKPS